MNNLLSFLTIPLLLLFMAKNALGTVTYNVITSLPDIFDYWSCDINNSGQMVGHGCLYSNGILYSLESLIDPASGWSSCGANAINNLGQIVGVGIHNGNYRHFVYNNGTMTDLGITTVFGDTIEGPQDINDSGKIVGFYTTTETDENGYIWYASHAYLYNNGTVTELGTLGGPQSEAYGINDLGQVVGTADTIPYLHENGYFCPDMHAFLYINGNMTDLGTLGGLCSEAMKINNSGQVAGYSHVAPEGIWPIHAFFYSNGTMTDLGTFGGPHSWAYDINSSGQVVGTAQGDATGAFIFSNGTMTNLNDLIDPTSTPTISGLMFNNTLGGSYMLSPGTPSPSSLELYHAYAINDSGQIVGYGSAEYYTCFLLSPTSTEEITATWDAPCGGSWLIGSNWDPKIVPWHLGDTVNFANSIGYMSAEITLNANKLIMDNGDSVATVEVLAGQHTIGVPLELHSNVSITTNSYTELNISEEISELGGSKSLTKTGDGKLILSASNSYTGATTINEGVLELTETGQIALDSLIFTNTNGTFQVNGGSHTVGAIDGAGATILLADSEVIATCIVQGHISIGSGAKLIIAPSGESMSLSDEFSSVPEPSALVLLAIGAVSFFAYRKQHLTARASCP